MKEKFVQYFRRTRHKAIVKKLEIRNESKVLDASCQDGSFLSVLFQKGKDEGKIFDLFGVDIDEVEIEKAKESFPNFNFSVTKNDSLPFIDDSFDLVISSMTLHHLENPKDSVFEMKRVLKDDGCIYLVDLIAKSRFFYSILRRFKCPEPYHFEKFYLLSDVETLLRDNELKIERVSQVQIPTLGFTSVLVLKITKI